jgi:DNA-binding SARP family transcriptional activator
LLGPMVVTVDGRPVAVGAARLRTLLAVLALSAGVPVSVERLAAALWGEELPANTRRTVNLYLTRLRQMLGPDLIHTHPAGYALAVEPDRVDALHFTRLLKHAAGAPGERRLLGEALALWRGAPLADVRSRWLADVEVTRLADLRLSALERRIELDLAGRRAGNQTAELIGELQELTAAHPLREAFWALLITALHRAGRQADALAAYRRLHRLLDDQLGVEPGPAVSEAHRRVLHGVTATPAALAWPGLVRFCHGGCRPAPWSAPAASFR